MFRKDNMFKKVQMRFFAIVISILLTVFIALLASVNLIMQAVMQRQSKVVLKQIAADIEYDEATSTFTYYPDMNGEKAPPPQLSEKDTRPEITSENKAAEDTTAAPSSAEDKTEEQTNESTSGMTNTDSQNKTDAPTNAEQTSPAVTESVNPTHGQTIGTEAVHTDKAPENTTVRTTAQNQPQTQTHTAPHDPFQPPFNDWQPPYDHRNDNPPPNGDGSDFDFNYPPNFDEWWEWHYNEYNPFPHVDSSGNETCYPESTTSSESDTTSAADEYDEISPLSGGLSPVLDSGFSVVRRMDKKEIPEKPKSEPIPKSLGSIDFFVLMADSNGKFLASLNNEEIESEVAQKYIDAILGDGASSGMLNSYQFCTLGKDNGTIMVFTDKSAEIDMLNKLSRTTVKIGAVSFIILAIIAYFLSKKCIEPVKIAFDKQKQFISDASHELKTPLTIISANADVLTDEIGENKWLEYIKSQAERMNVLVNDLLSLTRLENNTAEFICSDFDLSKAVESSALPFECRAFEENRQLEIDIPEGITVNGSEKHIRQMAAIFIDNALKYSNEGGTVRVTLSEQGDKKLLSVFNTGSGVKESEKDKIFERFYRSDDSRCRMTGGYGLGLAIAKSIIDKHHFKVTVDNHEGESICFNILM